MFKIITTTTNRKQSQKMKISENFWGKRGGGDLDSPISVEIASLLP